MSDQWPPPEPRYPGYEPAKAAFWNKRKSAGVGGVAGLLLGLVVGGVSVAALSDPDPKSPEVRSIVDAEVAAATSELDDEVAQARGAASDAESAAEEAVKDAEAAAEEAVTTAVAKAVAEADAAAAAAAKKAKDDQAAAVRKAVQAALAKERAKQQAAEPRPLAGSGGDSQGGATDPIFGTCGEANAHGYGPYTRGVDPEYDHYDDRDDDGLVCER